MNPEELFNQAYQHHRARRFVDALHVYKKLVQQFPDSERASVARQQIRNLRAFDRDPAASADSQQSNSSRGAESANGGSRPNFATFQCIRCGILLRVSLDASASQFRCGHCRHCYLMKTVSNDPKSFLIIPDATWDAARSSASEERPYPPNVREAFAVLGIQPTEDLFAIKRAYREMVMQYHPDKVAHLGADLRRLADEKTRALVSSLQLIKAFLGS
jgi:DnaJ-domain-containing protein 1